MKFLPSRDLDLEAAVLCLFGELERETDLDLLPCFFSALTDDLCLFLGDLERDFDCLS